MLWYRLPWYYQHCDAVHVVCAAHSYVCVSAGRLSTIPAATLSSSVNIGAGYNKFIGKLRLANLAGRHPNVPLAVHLSTPGELGTPGAAVAAKTCLHPSIMRKPQNPCCYAPRTLARLVPSSSQLCITHAGSPCISTGCEGHQCLCTGSTEPA
jgi:hypothetical protein